MVKSRGIMLLFTLGLLIATAGFVGHFVVDAVCVMFDAADGYGCDADTGTDDRAGSTLPATAEIHGTLNLPTTFPALSVIAQAFILAAVVIYYFTYSPSPASPPPRLFS